MNRLISFTAAVLVSLALVGELRAVDRAPTDDGVDYATSTFSSALTTVTFKIEGSSTVIKGRGVFYGVEFSSGRCSDLDFVDVFDSTAALLAIGSGPNAATGSPRFRYYNVSGSTSTVGDGLICSGWNGPKYPVRYSNGLLFKPSVATYNSIRLYLDKFGN